MIPVNTPLLDGNEEKYVLECLRTGWISSEGPFVERFEREVAQYVGRKHGIAVANGSAALDVAVCAAGIGPGDEVIMPSFTIISPATSVVRAGGVPVLVDSDPITWNIDVTQIEQKITAKTKAIIVVHIYGLPSNLDVVLEIARRHHLKVIEDAAEMHGQTYRGRPCGSFGLLSTFSFYPNKHITTGEGGMVLTDDDDVAEHCRRLRNLCFQPPRRFVHEELGWNYRMTNLQAALGVAQLEKLTPHIERKRRMGRRYQQLLEGTPGIQLPAPSAEYAESIYWVFGVLLDPDLYPPATEVMAQLAQRGIGTRPFFYPMHRQPVFLKRGWYAGEQYPVADKLGDYGFYLPSGLALTDSDQVTAATALRDLLRQSIKQ